MFACDYRQKNNITIELTLLISFYLLNCEPLGIDVLLHSGIGGLKKSSVKLNNRK